MISANFNLISTLFSGKEQSCLANRPEEGIKELIYQKCPEYRNDTEKNIDQDTLIRVVENIVKTLQSLC